MLPCGPLDDGKTQMLSESSLLSGSQCPRRGGHRGALTLTPSWHGPPSRGRAHIGTTRESVVRRGHALPGDTLSQETQACSGPAPSHHGDAGPAGEPQTQPSPHGL